MLHCCCQLVSFWPAVIAAGSEVMHFGRQVCRQAPHEHAAAMGLQVLGRPCWPRCVHVHVLVRLCAHVGGSLEGGSLRAYVAEPDFSQESQTAARAQHQCNRITFRAQYRALNLWCSLGAMQPEHIFSTRIPAAASMGCAASAPCTPALRFAQRVYCAAAPNAQLPLLRSCPYCAAAPAANSLEQHSLSVARVYLWKVLRYCRRLQQRERPPS